MYTILSKLLGRIILYGNVKLSAQDIVRILCFYTCTLIITHPNVGYLHVTMLHYIHNIVQFWQPWYIKYDLDETWSVYAYIIMSRNGRTDEKLAEGTNTWFLVFCRHWNANHMFGTKRICCARNAIQENFIECNDLVCVCVCDRIGPGRSRKSWAGGDSEWVSKPTGQNIFKFFRRHKWTRNKIVILRKKNTKVNTRYEYYVFTHEHYFNYF